MAIDEYIICDSNDITNIADAIREQTDTTDTMSISEMPAKVRSISGSGSDISLGLTGATVGQSVQVTAIDANGKPTAWATVNRETPSDTQVETAINNFLSEHPVAAGATEEQANQIIQNKQDIQLLSQDFDEYNENAIIAVDPIETPEVGDLVEVIKTEIRGVGTTQKTEITNLGTTVKNSIPTDYTTLTNDVNELKNDIDNFSDTDKCKIQWYRGGYNTSTGKWSGNNLYSEDSNATMMHPAPIQMLEGDVVPCPDGYTVSIAMYKHWHNTDDFEYTTSIGRRSTPYTITASRSGYWIMPTYKTANSDVVCDQEYSFKVAGLELIRTITPMLARASSYYSMTKRVNALENKMETMARVVQSLTGSVLEKLDSISAVKYVKKNIDPDNATGFGIWLIRESNIGSMNGIPDNSGHAMLINIEQKSFYAASQFYIMVSGNHAGMIYTRTKNKKSWSGVAWTVIGGVSQ